MKNIDILIKLAAPSVEYGPRAEADLARILATPTPRPLPKPRSRGIYGLAAALVLIALISGVALFRPTPASATPPLLTTTPIAGAAHEHLMALADLRRRAPAQHGAVELHAWTLVTEIDETGKISTSHTSPTITTTTFHADDSQTRHTVAGTPFPGQDPTGLQPPGTLLENSEVPPDQPTSAWLPSPLPTKGAALPEWIQATFGSDPTDTEHSTANLLSIIPTTPITPAQEASVLEYLATQPDVTLLGEVTDRLGRPGLQFRAGTTTDDNYEQLLVVSTDTGQVIAAETVYTGQDRTDITAPAVTSYEAWTRK